MKHFFKTLALTPHPRTPCGVVRTIHVDIALAGRVLKFGYHINAAPEQLAVPAYEEPVRADGLWQETCCEAFLRGVRQGAYYEINLSPSTQWAVYRFDGYREGMRPVDIGAAPVIDRETTGEGLVLHAEVDLAMLPQEMATSDWQLGLSCVIRGVDDTISYWALSHPPEKPDFHHKDCFALPIRAAERV